MVNLLIPTCAATLRSKSAQDPATEFAAVHRTLHHFCTAADEKENEDAGAEVNTTFPLLLDLLRACFPPSAAGSAAADATAAAATSAVAVATVAATAAAATDGESLKAPVAAALSTAAAAARQAALLKADLIHNPGRFEGWLALATLLDDVKAGPYTRPLCQLNVSTFRGIRWVASACQ
jgi:hypothetical protein